jgi:hypothetical protein
MLSAPLNTKKETGFEMSSVCMYLCMYTWMHARLVPEYLTDFIHIMF